MKIAYVVMLLTFCEVVHGELIAPIEVTKECIRQMTAGVCYARPSKQNGKGSETILLSGAGRVQLSSYLDFIDAYNPQKPNDPKMCILAFKYMTSEPGSDHDKIARALWTPR